MTNAQRIAVGDAELAFQIVGSAEPGLVLLHEGLGSIELWRSFPRDVVEATGEAALVYDRRGHGRSTPLSGPRTETYLHESALDELAGVLDRIPVTDPILIGHSDGATIGLLHAAHHPVAGLVLIAPHVDVEPEAAEGIRRTDRDSETLIERLGRYHDRPRALYTAWRDIWLDPDFAAWDITADICGLDAPILLIQGSDDEYGTLGQLDRIEGAVESPTERLVIEGAGHSPHLTHSHLVTTAVVRFVASIRDRPHATS